MNLLTPLANLFRSPERRERDAVLSELTRDLKRAERRLKEAYTYADDLVQGWERERDEILYGSGLGGRRGGGKGGDRWPFLRNMEDLVRMRQLSREACEWNGYGAGMLDRAIDFVIGDGMAPEVTLLGPSKGAVATGVADADGDGRPDADPAVENVTAVIDEFRRLNDWGMGEEDREEEGFRRSQRDGEVFVRFFEGSGDTNGIPYVRWVEPEQVDAPPDGAEWRWGIRYKKGDVESKEAAWVFEVDDTGGDWVPWSELVYHKLGTDRTVLRGVPQFWLVAQALEQSEKLNSNVTEVAAIQAKIALIRQHISGLLPNQITDYVGAQANVPPSRVGSRYTSTQQLGPGAVVMDTANGEQLLPGPVSTGVPGFIQGLQSRLRQVCARFGYPEFFTGDASNNNYASSLTAGGPAERAFKRKQHRYAAFQAAVYYRACEYAVKAGRLSAADLAAVEIKVKPGGVAIANKLEEAQVQQIRIQNKLLSPQSAMLQNGDDPKVEMANIKAFDDQFGTGAMGLGGMGGGQGQDDPFGGGFAPTGESYTGEEYELLSEADRSGLVRKNLGTDKRGRKIVRWVRPDERGGGVSRGDADNIRAALDAAVKDPKSLTPESVALIERHAGELTTDERRKYAKALRGAGPKPQPQKTAADVAPPKVSPEEAKAFYDYSEDVGYDLNATLREGDTPTGREKQVFDAVNKVIESRGQIDPPVTVYRALSWSHPEDKAAFLAGVKAGGDVTLAGLQSTSLDRGFVEGAFGERRGGAVVMEIVARKGVRMAGDMTAHESQKEVLLPHGAKFRVVGVEEAGGKTVLKMEQL